MLCRITPPSHHGSLALLLSLISRDLPRSIARWRTNERSGAARGRFVFITRGASAPGRAFWCCGCCIISVDASKPRLVGWPSRFTVKLIRAGSGASCWRSTDGVEESTGNKAFLNGWLRVGAAGRADVIRGNGGVRLGIDLRPSNEESAGSPSHRSGYNSATLYIAKKITSTLQ